MDVFHGKQFNYQRLPEGNLHVINIELFGREHQFISVPMDYNDHNLPIHLYQSNPSKQWVILCPCFFCTTRPPSALTALLSQRRQVKRQFRVPRVQGWRRRRALRAQRCAAHAQAPRFGSRWMEVISHDWTKGTRYGYGSIPIDTFLVGWTPIYQLFWCSPGVPGFWPIPICLPES